MLYNYFHYCSLHNNDEAKGHKISLDETIDEKRNHKNFFGKQNINFRITFRKRSNNKWWKVQNFKHKLNDLMIHLKQKKKKNIQTDRHEWTLSLEQRN